MPVDRHDVLSWDADERRQVLGPSFYASLESLCGQRPIDLVLFTGDLADWGHPSEYLAATLRLDAVLKSINVSRDRFFAVPGNHDVQRSLGESAWEGIRRWRSQTHDTPALGRWFRRVKGPPPGLQSEWREQVLERTAAFWNWMDAFGRGELRPQAPRLLGYRKNLPAGTFPGVQVPVHIIGLDSAWLCGGDDDQGQIVVTEEQVQGHVGDGEKALDGFRIALIHHPLDHLADHIDVRRHLSGTVDLLLHGHQHSPVAMTVSEPGAHLRVLAAGCLMEGDVGKGWPNSFHLIEVDLPSKRYAVHFRRWARDAVPRHWSPGTDLYECAPDGVLRWADGRTLSGEEKDRPEVPATPVPDHESDAEGLIRKMNGGDPIAGASALEQLLTLGEFGEKALLARPLDYPRTVQVLRRWLKYVASREKTLTYGLIEKVVTDARGAHTAAVFLAGTNSSKADALKAIDQGLSTGPYGARWNLLTAWGFAGGQPNHLWRKAADDYEKFAAPAFRGACVSVARANPDSLWALEQLITHYYDDGLKKLGNDPEVRIPIEAVDAGELWLAANDAFLKWR